MQSKEIEAIWREGHQAYMAGLSENSNPYPPGVIEHELWSDGWEDGQEDEQQNMSASVVQ